MNKLLPKYYLLILLVLIIHFPGLSQEIKDNNIKRDTIILTKDVQQKSIDTLYINNQIKSDKFYDSLITKASKNRITKTALNLLLVSEPRTGNYIGIENLKNEDYYNIYSGRKIRNIEFVKLDIFGPSIYDASRASTKILNKTGNKIHINTRDFIIRNNLFFESGDTVNSKLLVDNERFLREQAYIKDAIIQIVEIPNNNEFVDILVITKDVFSTGLYIDAYNENSGIIELYENNLAGVGHKVQASLFLNTLESPITGYEFNYNIDNIGGTFIRANAQYEKAFSTEKLGIELSRNFINFQTKWAGGLSIFKISTLTDIHKYDIDTTLIDVRLNYTSQDIWLGRSFLINAGNWQYKDRTRLVLSTRYQNNVFYKGPEVQERYNYPYHDNQIALFSIAFSQQKYYKSNLIYAFGKTEDIPIGNLLQANIGFEKDEFYKRPYLGLRFSKGTYFSKIGYLNIHTELGGFYYEDQPEQGVFKVTAQSISNLHYLNKLKLREFLSVNYTRGVNRFSDEKIFLNNMDITGFSSDNLFGLQKVAFHSELVAFTNLYVYNFRFLFFGFGDLGLIGPENRSIFSNKLYSGIGIGVRVRNENLVFKTFQIKFAFYPTVPNDILPYYINISGENYQKITNFDPAVPYIIDFK